MIFGLQGMKPAKRNTVFNGEISRFLAAVFCVFAIL
jgi:hypothetical protein